MNEWLKTSKIKHKEEIDLGKFDGDLIPHNPVEKNKISTLKYIGFEKEKSQKER